MYQIQRNGSLIRMELLLKQQSESSITENNLLKQNQIMIKKKKNSNHQPHKSKPNTNVIKICRFIFVIFFSI